MLNVEPFLIFNGNCEEAFTFYESVFGVKVTNMMRYKDTPESDRKNLAEKDMERIMYADLHLGKTILMFSDAPSDMPVNAGDMVQLTINTESKHEAEQLFKKLSEGGKVMMPPEKTFFADLYTMFTDKFGINWMILYMSEKMKNHK